MPADNLGCMHAVLAWCCRELHNMVAAHEPSKEICVSREHFVCTARLVHAQMHNACRCTAAADMESTRKARVSTRAYLRVLKERQTDDASRHLNGVKTAMHMVAIFFLTVASIVLAHGPCVFQRSKPLHLSIAINVLVKSTFGLMIETEREPPGRL